MTKNVSVTPGAITVLGARIGAIIAALFLILGVTFAYVVLQDLGSDDSGERLMTIMFFVVFIVGCALIFVMYLRIGFAKGPARDNSFINLEFEESGDQDKTSKS